MLSNSRAEEDVIGLLFRNPTEFFELGDMITEADFESPILAAAFIIIRELATSGIPVNSASIQQRLDTKPDEPIGIWFAKLRNAAPESVRAQEQAWIVKDASLRRQVAIASQGSLTALQISRPVEETIEVLMTHLTAVTSRQHSSGTSVGEIAARVWQRGAPANKLNQPPVIRTRLSFVDDAIGAMLPEDFIVLGGSTSHGKTALSQQIALDLAQQGIPGVFFSLEMSDEQIVTRFIAQLSGVPLESIETNSYSRAEFVEAEGVVEFLQGIPLHIIGMPTSTVSSILARVMAFKRMYDIKFAVVDHLHYIESDKKTKDRFERIDAVARSLKAAAKRTKIPWLCLAHVSREAHKRDNKRPMVSDLFGASEIEKSADVVFFIHRPEMYVAEDEPPERSDKRGKWLDEMERVRGMAEIVVAKRRRGKGKGIWQCRFNGAKVMFEDARGGSVPAAQQSFVDEL
jgi:replicative DNA helicase